MKIFLAVNLQKLILQTAVDELALKQFHVSKHSCLVCTIITQSIDAPHLFNIASNFNFQGMQSEGVIKNAHDTDNNSRRQLAINNVRNSDPNGSTFFFLLFVNR